MAENGKTSTVILNALNLLRLERLKARGVFESNERVASIDNDVADLLSRGAIQDALRFPQQAGLSTVKCEVKKEYRQMPTLPSTRA